MWGRVLNAYTPYGQPNSAGTYEARYSGVFAPDNEPDVYTLALPTGTLQFVFDPSGNPVTLQAQNIKIEALNLSTRTYNANGILHEFLVTTSDGVKYYFGSQATSTGYKEHVTVSTRILEISGLGSKKDPLPYINKWHLRQIVYPSGETIDYTYSPNQNYEVSTNNYLQQDWVFTAFDGTRFDNCYSCLDIGHPWKMRVWQKRYTIRTTIASTDTKQLASITSAQGSLQFSYQAAARKDIGGTTKALSGVRLLNTRGDLVKRLDLVQHYADYGQTVQDAMTYDRYHLLLDRIVDRGAGCDYTNLWQFGYNQNTFCRNAATKDYWGYLNGLTYPSDGNLVASYATPAVSTITYALPGRNRTPSLSFTQYMILQSITSAAGSVQSFDYQLNDDNAGIGASARNIGGLRIYRISKYDGISHTNDVVDEFTYRKADNASQSSGTSGDWGMYEKLQLIHEDYDRLSTALPLAGYWSDEILRATVPVCYNRGSNRSRTDYYYLLRSDASMYEYAFDYIDYSCVTVGHGTKGKTRYEFTSWADATHQDYVDPDTRQVGNNLNAYPQNPLSPTSRGAVLSLPFSLAIDGLSLLSSYNGTPVYTPGISADFPRRSSRSAERGLPLRVTQLTTGNVAVAATLNEYDFSRSTFTSPTVQTTTTLPIVNAVYVKPSLEAFGFSQYFFYFQLYYYNVASQWCPLINTTEIVYNQNSGGDITKSVATRTAVEYADFFPSKITKYTTTCSSPALCQSTALGQYQVTVFRRAQSPSFADGTTGRTNDRTSSAGLLYHAGMMAPVIEQEQYTTATLNGSKIAQGASLSTYRLNNGHVVPNQTYASPPGGTFTPVTVALATTGWALVPDGSYQLTATATGYTAGDLPVNNLGRDGLPRATIWGYGRTLPIASVTNGTAATGTSATELRATSGHTSFEEDGVDGDGWTLPAAANFSSEAKSGRRSVKYVATQSPFGLRKDLVLTSGLNRTGKLLFSCWAKVPNSGTTSTSFLLVASSTLGGYKQSAAFILTPGQDWKYCEFSIDLTDPTWANAGTNLDLPLRLYSWVPSNTGEFLVDEVRVHRADAQMQTMTYQPLVGKTSHTGADGRTTYFTYSSDNSPYLVLDHNRDVVSRTQSKVVNQTRLTADFSPDYGNTQSPVNFVAERSGCSDGTSYTWNFGDQSALGSGANPSHAYAAAGTYQVTLIASSPQKGVAKLTKAVSICGPYTTAIDVLRGDLTINCCTKTGNGAVGLTARVNNSQCYQAASYRWQRQYDNGNWVDTGVSVANYSFNVLCGATVNYRCIIVATDGSTNEYDPAIPIISATGINIDSGGVQCLASPGIIMNRF